MKRTLCCCLTLVLLAGCAGQAPAALRQTPPRDLEPGKAAAAGIDPHPVAAFLIEPFDEQDPAHSMPREEPPSGGEFLAVVRVTDPKGNAVEGLNCETGGIRAATDSLGRCLLPMRVGAAQLLQLSNREAATFAPVRYLVTAREAAEEELLLLWNGPVGAPAAPRAGQGGLAAA